MTLMSKYTYYTTLVLLCLALVLWITASNKKSMSDQELNEQKFAWLTNNTAWYQSGSYNGWAGYDRVYFITLPQRLDNVKQIAATLGIANDAWILKAIHKNHINFTEVMKLRLVDPYYFWDLKPERYGRIGCQLSHLAVLLHCFADKTVDTCVIFEDDLRMPEDTVTNQVNNFRQEYEKLNLPLEIVYLDFCYGQTEEVINSDVLKLKGCGCMHAYAIKKDAFPKIFNMVNPMSYEIDRAISNNMQKGTIFAIGPTKPVFFQQDRTKFGTTLDAAFIEHKEIIPKFQDP